MAEKTKEVNVLKVIKPSFITLTDKPANQATFKIVRSDIAEEERVDKPYGDVPYADPGYQEDGQARYPVDTEAHIRAAWSYANQEKNAAKYSASELKKIKNKIIKAWKDKIDKAGPPSAASDTERSDNVDTTVRRVRVRRSDSPLLMMEFPQGTIRTDVELFAKTYGLDTYSIDEEEGVFSLRRDNAQRSDTDWFVTLEGGVKARIAQIQRTDIEKQEVKSISISSFEFDREVFATQDKVLEWAERKDIDFLENGMVDQENIITVKRLDIPEGQDIRRMEIDTGVIAVITRQDEGGNDIPDSMMPMVVEGAYGNWGWGHLDFAQALNDTEFCESVCDAIEMLESVVRNIVFYNHDNLDLKTRKSLIATSANEFVTYIGSLIDALPTQVVLATRSILEKEKAMSEKTSAEAKTTVRDDDPKNVVEDQPKVMPEYVTRSDITQIVQDAVKAAMEAQRSDPDKKEDDVKADVKEEPKETDIQVVTRSIKEVADSVKSVADTLKAVNDRVSTIESTTVVRSDQGDGKQQRGDIFKGIFGGKKEAA